jgi:putative ABC transport system substrate-binding protein
MRLLGGTAGAWPLAARGQQPARVRRIGMLSEFSEPQMRPMIEAFQQRLREFGWSDQAIRIDSRSATADATQFAAASAALVDTGPDVIVVVGSRALRALKERTQTIPVVFTLVADPVAQGLVDSLAKPGGNLTGLTNFEFSFAGKWFEALKEIEPRVARILLVNNPQNSGTLALARFVEGLGASHDVEMVPAPVKSVTELQDALTGFGQGPDHAIIVLPDGLVVNNRGLIIEYVNRNKIPVVYPFRVFAESGGLLSWGLDFVEVYRQAATYVDRILRGARPAELPIQAPNKFNLVINLQTAKTVGLKIPATLLALADEVIE